MDTGLCRAAGFNFHGSTVDWTEQEAGWWQFNIYKNPWMTIDMNLLINILSQICFQTNGFFRFIDGWSMTFANWAPGEPSTDRPCVYVDVDGSWKTAFCNETMNSACLQSSGKLKSYSHGRCRKVLGINCCSLFLANAYYLKRIWRGII